MDDRTEWLRQAAQARHDTSMAKATNALSALARSTEPVSFGRLARTAGVSRSWLYRQPELRRQVEDLRRSRRPGRSPAQTAQRASDDSNRERLALYRAELARLKAENQSLREQIARKFGAERAAVLIGSR